MSLGLLLRLLVILLLPTAAAAQTVALTAASVTMHAGPDVGYPTVTVLAPGAQVIVQACLPDYRWCDVSFGWDRGWVEPQALYFDQGGARVPLAAQGALLPVAPFYIEDYWGSHYGGRPWYGERHRWIQGRQPVYPNQPLPPGTPVPGYRPPAVGQPTAVPAPRPSSPPEPPRAPGLGRPSR